MDLYLEGKKALIIGAGHGIGSELVSMLLGEGCSVCAVAHREISVSELREKNPGRSLLTFAADLVPERAECSLFAFLEKQEFMPDILVHCMGGKPDLPAGTPPYKVWRAWYRILFELPFIFDETFLPAMREKGWGRIVHTGSVASLEAQGPTAYCSFKAMQAAYVRAVGRKEAARGVVMSAVLPGAFTAPDNRWERLLHSDPESAADFVRQRMPIGRLGTAREIASFMLFLCSEQASFNAGGIYTVDGAQGTAFFLPES